MPLLDKLNAACKAFWEALHGAAPQLMDQESDKDRLDPLSPFARITRNDSIEDNKSFELRDAMDDLDPDELASARAVGDSAVVKGVSVGDDSTGRQTLKQVGGFQGVPEGMSNWYMSQAFIGWQACSIIAQHWLVNKACEQSGLDAVRHGWEVNIVGGEKIDPDVMDRIKEIDEDFGIKNHLSNMSKFTNMFGIRVCIYEYESASGDREFYAKPFNIDDVKPGSYKGIRQVDPYWTAPLLDSAAASDPTSRRFYKPTWWIIGGKKYHYTHLHVSLGPEVSDILKPVYYYGGLPLVQRIYERVYAAERTANEAPLLSMSKRTTVLHVDLKKMASNQRDFESRLSRWVEMRDNHAVKVLGLEENMEQQDISLSDFDSVIMNQYQLVAAIAETPATKLLGTSPKGFNATGEFEEKSYHEKLETIQSDEYNPMLSRHYKIMMKSCGWDFRVEVAWNPTDAKTAEAQAEINAKKVDTGTKLINAGVISADEERNRVRTDKFSGYTGIGNEEAEQNFLEPGELEHPGAEEKGEAALKSSDDKNPPVDSAEEPAREFPESEVARATVNSPKEVKSTVAALNESLSKVVSILEKKLSTPRDAVSGSVKAAVEPGVTATARQESPVPAKERTAVALPTHPTGEGESGRGTITDVRRSPVGDAVGETVRVMRNLHERDLPKIDWDGYKIVVENPAGTVRQGKTWEAKMAHHYGYLMGTEGADGDCVDVFVGPDISSPNVYIVDQTNKDGAFDEHKVMIGFSSEEEAKQGYIDSFSEGWDGFSNISELSIAEFRNWLGKGDTSKPYYE